MRSPGPLSRRGPASALFRRPGVLVLLFFLAIRSSWALATGVPLVLTVDPAIVRATDAKDSNIVATLTLKGPSPSFFICNVHSSDPDKVHFKNLIFKKGQLQGSTSGTVHWRRVRVDCDVRVSAYSEDAPGEKLWFTIRLKPKDDSLPAGPAAPAGT